MAAKLKIAVLGATGYSGLELARLLGRHPRTDAPLLFRRGAEADGPAPGSPQIPVNGNSPVQSFSWTTLQQHGVELLFLATPHSVSRELVPEAIARGLRVVDLSGAWRLKQEENRAVYGFKDADAQTAAELTERAVYGLPELKPNTVRSRRGAGQRIRAAMRLRSFLHSPLARSGIVDCDRGIISDSKSGVSGAGKEPTARTHFVSVADNFPRTRFLDTVIPGKFLSNCRSDAAS